MEAKINEQCAAMLGWVDVRSNGLPHCGLWHDADGKNTLYRVEGNQAFTPATNRDHAYMVWDSLSLHDKGSVSCKLCLGNVSLADDIDAALDPERLCRAILDVMRPGWEETR